RTAWRGLSRSGLSRSAMAPSRRPGQGRRPLTNRYPGRSNLPEGAAGRERMLAARRIAHVFVRPMIPFPPALLRALARLAAVAALAAALPGCGGAAGPFDVADNYPKPGDYPIHGIDVSKYQGTIDWRAVADSGVKFVWIKATEGGDRLDDR